MCNLYANTAPQSAMRRLFGVAPSGDRLGNFAPLPAIFPRQSAPVVRREGDGGRALVMMHWGFLLAQKSQRTGQPIQPKAVTNARDDKLRRSPFWAESFAIRRCLVPATSFAEAKGRNPATYYWFALAGDDPAARPPFAFAGLWRRFHVDDHGERGQLDTFTIVTTTPNDLVRPIHPSRMPVILAPADHGTWLDGSPQEAARLTRPFPAARMRIVRQGAGLRQDSLQDGDMGAAADGRAR